MNIILYFNVVGTKFISYLLSYNTKNIRLITRSLVFVKIETS